MELVHHDVLQYLQETTSEGKLVECMDLVLINQQDPLSFHIDNESHQVLVSKIVQDMCERTDRSQPSTSHRVCNRAKLNMMVPD